MTSGPDIPKEEIAAFCRKWRIAEFCLFGSVLREDFGVDSDVDVLVDFEKKAHWSLLDLFDMRQELKRMYGRDVDLLTRRAVEKSHNWIRRRAILSNAKLIYAQ